MGEALTFSGFHSSASRSYFCKNLCIYMPTLEHQRKPTNPCNRNAILNDLFNARCLSQVEACCLTNDHWQLAFGALTYGLVAILQLIFYATQTFVAGRLARRASMPRFFKAFFRFLSLYKIFSFRDNT